MGGRGGKSNLSKGKANIIAFPTKKSAKKRSFGAIRE